LRGRARDFWLACITWHKFEKTLAYVVSMANFTSISTQLVDFFMKNLESVFIDLFMLGKLNMLPDLIGTIRYMVTTQNF
jgi:hypothetical protein